MLDHLESRSGSGQWRDRRLRAAASVAAYTGLRRDELLFLRLEDIDLSGGLIRVVPTGERGLKTRDSAQPVPIPPELAPILERRIPDSGPGWLLPGVRRESAWHGGQVGKRPIDDLRRAGDAVGIRELSWQSLRRSWATHAESAWCLTDPQIQRVLRHTSPLTSRRHYPAADADNLRAIGSRVSYQVC